MKYAIHIKGNKRTLVHIPEFEIQSGKITFLLGESGIGKTLISRAVFGLLAGEELNVQINGDPYARYLVSSHCRDMRDKGFFVFQEPSSHLNPMRRLSAQLDEGSIADSTWDKEIISRLFPGFNEAERQRFLQVFPKPYRPSGGEKQRFLIAMAFKKILKLTQNIANPDALFIFDEPTGNLDNQYRNLFLQMLIEAQQQYRFTAIVITHDYSMIGEISARYPDMLAQINFSEIRLLEKTLQQIHFSPRLYLDWLSGVQPPVKDATVSSSPVLELSPQIRVFDRQLTVTSDAAGTTPSPLEIYPGDAVYLKAASGAGKTTTAKIIMGLLKAHSFSLRIGDLVLDEKATEATWRRHIWAKKISMVFQHADEALNLNGKVKDIFRGLPIKRRKDRSFLVKQLKIVFDTHINEAFLDKPVRLLSGGQKQRLNLLRSLILDTALLILDEPFNGLDFNTMQKVLTLLQDRQRQGKSFLLISHNEEIISRLVRSDRIYYLHWQRA